MNNYIEYKGYRGIIGYSDQDSVLYGKIMGIDDLVTFEGANVEEIKSAFFNAVVLIWKPVGNWEKIRKKNLINFGFNSPRLVSLFFLEFGAWNLV
ncbi:MAG: hypothetical protein JJE07_06735 [Flavobacteriaceae bacterium]|nr:hypothetical protein [Flavobacteriaceae bacterium]